MRVRVKYSETGKIGQKAASVQKKQNNTKLGHKSYTLAKLNTSVEKQRCKDIHGYILVQYSENMP